LSEKQKLTQSTVDRLAQELVELVEMFRKGGPASDLKWWGGETPHTIFDSYPAYNSGRKIFDAAVRDLLKLNPDMLSKLDVEWRLTYEFLERCAVHPEQLGGKELMNKARNYLNELVEFENWQEIGFPIMNLLLEGKPVKLGYVTFTAKKQDINQWRRDYAARLQGIADIHVIARVNAPGDLEKAASHARTQLSSALNVLRMLQFRFSPFTDSSRVAVVGEIPFSGSTPVRMNQKQIITQFRGSGFYQQPELRKLVSKELKRRQWRLINKLLLKPEGSRNHMENKLLDGIHWLGEAAKPDTNRARFVKISIALETLAGGEPKDEELKVRGITAMLAERAAFIVGKDLADRQQIDKDTRTHYRTRSEIVHGDRRDVPLSDVDNFAELARRVALALLEKLDKLGDELSTVGKLETWVRNQRYTLPRQS